MAWVGNDRLGKRTPEYFKLIKSIEQILSQSNGILIIMGGSQILHSMCCDFSSHDDASHNTLALAASSQGYRGRVQPLALAPGERNDKKIFSWWPIL
jgi:hypothetical protein